MIKLYNKGAFLVNGTQLVEDVAVCQGITKEEHKNRKLLRDLMEKGGFVPYENEWWHYSLKNEPYPDVYFDFVIE